MGFALGGLYFEVVCLFGFGLVNFDVLGLISDVGFWWI